MKRFNCSIQTDGNFHASWLFVHSFILQVSSAMALKSIRKGDGTYFVRAYDLVERLRKAMAQRRLHTRA